MKDIYKYYQDGLTALLDVSDLPNYSINIVYNDESVTTDVYHYSSDGAYFSTIVNDAISHSNSSKTIDYIVYYDDNNEIVVINSVDYDYFFINAFQTIFYEFDFEVAYAVDTDSPLISIGGLDDSEVYYTSLTPNSYNLIDYDETVIIDGHALARQQLVTDYYNGFSRSVLHVYNSNVEKYRFTKNALENDVYQSGYDTGYTAGYRTGYPNGYDLGYSDGYNVGYTDGSMGDEMLTAFDYIGQAVGGVSSILNIEILPHMSIGLLVTIPATMGIIAMIFRIIKK